jgi:hypothetical protein
MLLVMGEATALRAPFQLGYSKYERVLDFFYNLNTYHVKHLKLNQERVN